MSDEIKLQDASGRDESITEAELLSLTTDVQFSIAIVDDEPPRGHSLLRALDLKPNQARVFGIKDAAAAYRLFLSKPFPFDAVFVDWLLKPWPMFSAGLAGLTGVPDNMERAPTLTIFTGNERDRTDQGVYGGHSQLLVSLAAAHGALTVALSQHIAKMSPDGIALRARGAHAFLAKSELDEPNTSSSVAEIKELLYVMGGWSRDLRLWRSIQPDQFARVIEALRTMSSSEIEAKMSNFEGIGAKGRHAWLTAPESDLTDYLLGSLTNLAQPRLACSARLLAEAIPLLRSSDPRADGIFDKLAILQPSLCTPEGTGSSLALRLKSHLADIEKAHSSCELETGCDYLHVIVDAGVHRIDYYASRRPAPPATDLLIEHLGTSFEPKLAATMDANGVWPASKVSKLRHLLRASRDRRIFHKDGVIVRCAAGVFGPTIDSLVLGSVLMNLLRASQFKSAEVRRLVEVGTGTGFVLCLAASQLKETAEMIAGSDVSTDAIQCATHNLKLIWEAGLKEGKAHLVLSSDILAIMPAASVDMIISNPPYLPGKPGTLADDDSAIAGERVLRDILCGSGPRALRKNGVVIIVASTLSEAFVISALEEAERKAIHWHHNRLVSMAGVPLDLPEVLEDFEWTSALVEMKAADVLLDVTSAQYPLRHGVVVTAFSRSPSAMKRLQDAFRSSS